MYFGILSDLFGLNFKAFHIVDILLKTLATLSLYPLILTLFKNKLLAFLTTAIYSVIPTSSGALTLIIGIDYLAFFFTNLFGISYYYLITKRRGIFKTAALLLLVILSSYVRELPILIVISLIEISIILKNLYNFGISKKLFSALFAFITRIVVFYFTLKFFVFYSTSGTNTSDLFGAWKIYINLIKEGKWNILLNPLSLVGVNITDNNLLKKFLGDSPNIFTLSRFVLMSSLVTLFISWLIKPKRKYLFFLSIFSLNLFAAIFILFFIKDVILIPATLFGLFFLILGLVLLFEWLFHQNNEVLILCLAISPFWILLFASYVWLSGRVISDNIFIHRYWVIPGIGMALFLATVFLLIYKKIGNITSYKLKMLMTILLIFSTLFAYIYETNLIRNFFIAENNLDKGLAELEKIRTNFLITSANMNRQKPILLYIETAPNEDSKIKYSQKFLDAARNIVRYDQNQKLNLNCLHLINSNYDELYNSVIKPIGTDIEFNHSAVCPITESAEDVIFHSDEFYAYLLKEGQFYDIKQSIITRLRQSHI